MNTTQTLAALLVLAVTAACGNTADGARKDADKAADKTAEAAASTGEKMSGAMQTTEVKSALMADTRVDAGDINVDTDEAQKVVTLKGTVKTEAQRVLAGEVATSKAVGYSIVNNLTIKP